MKKILHKIGFHNPLAMEDTGEWELRFNSPFDLFPTRYNKYLCRDCGGYSWIPPEDFSNFYWNIRISKLKEEVANKWMKEGNPEMAVKVLRI